MKYHCFDNVILLQEKIHQYLAFDRKVRVLYLSNTFLGRRYIFHVKLELTRPSKMEVLHRRTDVRLALLEQIGGFGNWKDLKIGKI